MPRHEFSKRIKRDAFVRAKGLCEDCGSRLTVGKFHYDHDTPDALGGSNLLDNCRVLCVGCHGSKTSQIDVRRIAKAKRVYNKHNGIKKPSRFPGSRDSKFKRKMDGTVVFR